MSQATYRAVQAVAPGRLEMTEKPLVAPPPGYVRIRVEACGVCHSDSGTVDGTLPLQYPRVPGHEAVGVIDMVGEGVEGYALGQRVGVGFLAGSCGHCAMCRRGDLVNCMNQTFTGVQDDGGYAEVLVAKHSALAKIPDALKSRDAAPLLCAGLTTFSALRNAPARAGDRVAILGIGGLGHLAVQFARRMGFEVVAIGRGPGTKDLALRLGAHHYIDSTSVDVSAALNALGGAALVLATASGGRGVAETVRGLQPRGCVIALGGSPEPMEVATRDIVFASRSIRGALTGDPATADATMAFSLLTGVSPMIETMPLAKAADAYARMKSGDAKFRMVLTMDS